MKVKYIGDTMYGVFTRGCEYEVIDKNYKAYYLRDEEGDKSRVSSLFCEEVEEEQSSEWDGGECPHIGTYCQAQYIDSNLVRHVKIMSYNDGFVWVWDQNDYEHLVYPTCDVDFKPIKSEKDKESEKIDDVIDNWQDKYEMMAEKSLAEHLYDNGFRFVEN